MDTVRLIIVRSVVLEVFERKINIAVTIETSKNKDDKVILMFKTIKTPF